MPAIGQGFSYGHYALRRVFSNGNNFVLLKSLGNFEKTEENFYDGQARLVFYLRVQIKIRQVQQLNDF